MAHGGGEEQLVGAALPVSLALFAVSHECYTSYECEAGNGELCECDLDLKKGIHSFIMHLLRFNVLETTMTQPKLSDAEIYAILLLELYTGG
jgi:hypothetical protein